MCAFSDDILQTEEQNYIFNTLLAMLYRLLYNIDKLKFEENISIMFALKYKFQIRKSFLVVYLLLILLGLGLTIGRGYSQSTDFVIINTFITAHISNFSLSLMSYLAIGFIWLMQGVKFHYIVFLGCVYVIGNLLCETVMTFLNTPDIIDAYFGVFGTLISFLFLLLMNKYGLIPINNEHQK